MHKAYFNHLGPICSLCAAAGVAEMSVDSPDEYVRLAVRLATGGLPLLTGLRNRLLRNRANCPLAVLPNYTLLYYWMMILTQSLILRLLNGLSVTQNYR